MRAEILAMDPKIIELENRISVEQDAAARTKLETELAALNTRYNELVQARAGEAGQVARRWSATSRRARPGSTSLQNQAATQMVLINKLQTDTKQRVVLYDALSKSLKTAQQQDVAHRINEIGVKTDQEAQTAMAAIGVGHQQPDGRHAGGARGSHGLRPRGAGAKAKADERFARRFAEDRREARQEPLRHG